MWVNEAKSINSSTAKKVFMALTLHRATRGEARDLFSSIAAPVDELEGVFRQAGNMSQSYDYIHYDLKPCKVQKLN
jgi:hypothetical protein